MPSIRHALDRVGIPYTFHGITGRPYAFHPVGVMEHHTASRRGSGDTPALGLVLRGRGGPHPLPPPVVQVLIGRRGTVHVISEGNSNHAGRGEPRALDVARHGGTHQRARTAGTINGNPWFIGIEIENDGVGEPYPPEQLLRVDQVTAALCIEWGWNPGHAVLGHKEWTSGKIDPSYDMDAQRRRVTGIVHRLTTPDPEELTMADVAALIAAQEETNRLLRADGFRSGKSEWCRTPGDLRNIFPTDGPVYGELLASGRINEPTEARTLTNDQKIDNWRTFGGPPGWDGKS